MKRLRLVTSIAILSSVCLSQAAVLLDDRWEDGDRTDTNLPEESAWFASSATSTPTLSVATNALVGNVLMFGTNAGSRLWITHFTPAGSPVQLALWDTIKVTLMFIPSNVTTSGSTSRGMRIGLFNFSEPGAARVSADGFSTGTGGGAPGASVTGYLLNMNFAQAFSISSPLQIMKRTDTANVNLMGASAVFTALSSGGGASGSPGFSNGVPYKLEFSVTRYETFMEVTTRFSNTNGWSIFHSSTDTVPLSYGFDGFALRPNSVADSAESFTFTEFKAEYIQFAVRIASIEMRPNDALITWNARPGKRYQLEGRYRLDPNEPWLLVGSVDATGNVASFPDDEAPFEPQRFYRVMELP
jgi:hypothetical protein